MTTKFTATIETSKTPTLNGEIDSLSVTAFADGERIAGWGLKSSHRKLADRLVKAIESGKIFRWHDAYAIRVNGELVQIKAGWHANVLGRTMNADLKRFGF